MLVHRVTNRLGLRPLVTSLLLGGALAGPVFPQAPAPATAPVAGATASDLLTAGQTAYNNQDWAGAAQAFDEFLAQYGAMQETADAARRVKALLGICQVRLGQYEVAEKLLAESLADPKLDSGLRPDLRFFSGLAACHTRKFDEARKLLGAVFTDANVEPARRMEALVLGGLSYVMEENWAGAATFFQKYGPEIRAANPEAGARADVLHLHALGKLERYDEALALARDIHTRRDELRQVVTFATLVLDLGAKLLEKERFHAAISALALVPARADLEKTQEARLNEADADLQYARASQNVVRQMQLQTSVAEMERDLEAIGKMPQFDAAARLRLAQAYFALGRMREAALVLDQMVRQMPPDELVESASVNLISGWMSLERWNRAAKAAEVYIERIGSLPIAKNLPGVLFARAQALEGQFKYEEAAAGYADVAKRFPKDELAARARFMQAYNILQLERYTEAGQLLEALLKDINSQHEMWDHAFFWRAMAFYFDQKWEPARTQLTAYLERSASGQGGTGEYVDDALFRRGYAWFSEALYDQAVKDLETFGNTHPTSEWLPEALLTLGDCQGALGELEKADAAYQRISVEATGFHDEGWMKRGQILKARKDLPGMKAHYAAFLKARPDSPRVAEALQWLGWVAKQEGQLEDARAIYWDAMRKFGDEPARPALEDIFMALAGFYPGPQKDEMRALLQKEALAAEARKQPRYAARLAWAEAMLAQKPAPEESRMLLARLGEKLDPKETAPRLLVDCAEALAAQGDSKGAARLFDGLRKWYPRAPERDRAFAGLGFLALADQNEVLAQAMFDRFERTAVMPKSAPDAHGVSLVESEMGGRVALARAQMAAGTQKDQALHIYQAVQKSKALPSRLRAEAFIAAAALLAGSGREREALPYFEQVYVLYNRYPELVAKAYWGRGQALEKLGMAEKAREVYSELALREDLQKHKEAAEGRARAMALGGLITPKEPEGGVIPPAASTPKGGAS